MPKCPFAEWDEISGAVGSYTDGPFRIVHHTTEGTSYAGARSAYAAKKADPHFTVAGGAIFQHIDTSLAARALRNPPGGVQTNRHSALQIEVVGFAGRAKDIPTLRRVAELCRWIEGEHGVPQEWPNGPPRASTNGRDPGGHNRNAENWTALAGHYGHSQVPENDHWDPGYTQAELAMVTPDAVFDPHDELARVETEISREGVQAFRVSEAEQIAQRLLADATGQVRITWPGEPAQVRIRVVAGGTEIELDLDVGRSPAKRGAKPRRRRAPRKARRE